ASEDGLLWGVLAAALWLVTRWRRKPPFPPLTFDDAIRSAVAVGLACLVAVGVLALHIGVDVSGH
ncbi:MAG TPA: hypothetical protein VK348_07630, partial [Planctomycetota bacterium]|nr:hypothetical protein [Planctomycetota bacterium]